MEDQQSGPGDLTEAPAVDADVAADADADVAADADADADAAEPAGDDDTAQGSESSPEPVDPPARNASGRRLAALLGVVGALFVGAAAFAGAAVEPVLVDRAQVATKLDVAQTAAAAINTLWNYTPENMDTLVDRAAGYLSGDLEAQYRKFIDAIAEGNKQAKVTDTTEIVGVAVESLDGPRATVVVYTNTSAASELTKSMPSIKYLAYRLHLQRDHSRWRLTRMQTVTSLDLTPRL